MFERGKFTKELMANFGWLFEWSDYPQNPLVESKERDDWVADPTIVLPSESSDGNWHMFCSGRGIKHYVSEDGLKWNYKGFLFSGYSPFVFNEYGKFYLFYQTGQIGGEVKIVCRISEDLESWSDEVTVLGGAFSWERGVRGEPFVRNACVFKKAERLYMLYYSAGYVFLPDTGYEEPLYVGVAHAEDPTGPYRKTSKPVIVPSLSDPWRNLGAGAMKVYKIKDIYIGFNNGIYWGEDLHSHSAIHVLLSRDGIQWFDSPKNPIITPAGSGWKRSHVYQLDVKRVGRDLWMFYNARDGWHDATERIGLATCKIPARW